MSLRRKALFIFTAISIGLIGLLYFNARLFVMEGFLEQEEAQVNRNIQRLRNAVDADIDRLFRTAIDWGFWDETYDFVQGEHDTYIVDNLANDTLVNLGVNMMLFVNRDGELVFGKVINLDTAEDDPIPSEVDTYIASGSLLTNHQDTNSRISGFIDVGNRVMMVVSVPILMNDAQGPLQGSLIIGRYIDDAYVTSLGDSLAISVQAAAPAQLDSLPDFATVFRNGQTNQTTSAIEVISENQIAGYTILTDIQDEPVMIFRIDLPRDIYAQGQVSLNFFLLAMGAITIITLTCIWWGISHDILTPILSLSDTIARIRTTGELSLEIPIRGNDEIASLALDLKQMVRELDAAHKALKRAHDELEQRVEERTHELSEANQKLRQEIHHHQQTQLELQQARDQALEALRLKTQILANISHDARTPLNVIMLRADMLKRGHFGTITSKQIAAMDKILFHSQQLLGFFDNLVTEAQLTANKTTIHQAALVPQELLNDILNTMSPIAERKGLVLHGAVSPELPPQLMGDQERLSQIIINLVGNAIKFTESGQVQLQLLKSDDLEWIVKVSDTGQGIDEAALPHIFTPFWQVDGSMTRHANRGVGLGLSIVKQLVKLMDGHIDVNSKPGMGSTFIVRLPLLYIEESIECTHS